MQAQPLQEVHISGAGIPGNPGTIGWSSSNEEEADPEEPGRDGRDASPPTAGTPGRDVWVRLSYSNDRPTLIQVSGEGVLVGNRWEVARQQELFIDCRGGKGGDGGHGENGQPGGKGRRGANATKYSDARVGGPGAPGGDGGSGTCGADGGDAGNIYITVHEDDLDTLVGVTYSVQGGKGGLSGTHGIPGLGGIGGPGGVSYTWTEHHYHTMTDSYGKSHTKRYSTTHTRPGAPRGPDGPPGNQPIRLLAGGRSGRNGSCQIKVLRKDLTEGTYPSRYQLIVKDFDVVDENEDGINEPGEYLYVKNIQVENIGGMPSPKGNILKILIQSTPWLEPVFEEPLELPREIPPGATVRVHGVLRALIKNEFAPRALGSTLCAPDTVKLCAIFERLQRALPEFSGGARVVYQYPLVMSSPKYLDCVAKGDKVRFTWMLRNVSSKAYGSESALGRLGGTRLLDPSGVFDLEYANPETPHEAVDPIDILEAGAEAPITQDFTVSKAIQAFSTGKMHLHLELSDPRSDSLRIIQSYELSIQISSVYCFNPSSQFLLIVNSSTPNAAIIQVIDFIQNGLHLLVDVFNLGLTGSIANPETGQNVIASYPGKSVVIFGNTLNFFLNGTREPWDLLDPWEMCQYAKSGTNILVASAGNEQSLRGWASQVTFPVFALPPPEDLSTLDALSDVLKTIRSEPNEAANPSIFVAKKGMCRKLEKTLAAEAKLAARKLNKQLPLRRYFVAPCDLDAADNALNSKLQSSGVSIVEGLTKTAKVTASLFPYNTATGHIMEYHLAMLVHTLPFKVQAGIFWNLLGQDLSPGVDVNVVYRGEMLKDIPFGPATTTDPEKTLPVVTEQVCKAIFWSVTTQLTSELARFTTKSPWPDSSIPRSTILSQLPLLCQLLAAAPTTAVVSYSDGDDFWVRNLATVLATTYPIGVKQFAAQKIIRFGNRKARLASRLQNRIDNILATMCTLEVVKEIQKLVLSSAAESGKLLEGIKKDIPSADRIQRAHEFSRRALATLSSISNADFLDFIDVEPGSIALTREELAQRRQAYATHYQRREADEAWSKQMIKDMVNPTDSPMEEFEAQKVANGYDEAGPSNYYSKTPSPAPPPISPDIAKASSWGHTCPPKPSASPNLPEESGSTYLSSPPPPQPSTSPELLGKATWATPSSQSPMPPVDWTQSLFPPPQQPSQPALISRTPPTGPVYMGPTSPPQPHPPQSLSTAPELPGAASSIATPPLNWGSQSLQNFLPQPPCSSEPPDAMYYNTWSSCSPSELQTQPCLPQPGGCGPSGQPLWGPNLTPPFLGDIATAQSGVNGAMELPAQQSSPIVMELPDDNFKRNELAS